VAWGTNNEGQCNVPAGLSNVVDIFNGSSSADTVALKSDGNIVMWGDNFFGQCNVPAGLNQVVTAAAGTTHTLAVTSNGIVHAWGDNSAGQCNVPAGLRAIRVSAGYNFSVAIVSTPTDLYAAGSFGSDTTGDGTANNPFQTVTKALSLVPASSSTRVTIHINDGKLSE
jgi:alpha-tubulin suppressor-like RCC1 family protein